jgi:photosystem II stability/assembly factor-like uncharacterized protein
MIAGLLGAVPPALAQDEGGGALRKLTQRDRLYDTVVAGPQAWIVGFPGIILHTPDKGATWEAQAGGGKSALFAVDFINDREGWICGRSGVLLHTADAGKTWERLDAGTKEHLFDLDFVDSNLGWAVGNFGIILHTRDGGKTWVRQSVKSDPAGSPFAAAEGEGEPEFDRLLNGITFLDENNGWIAGESGTILHTTDGGKSWVPVVTEEWAPLYSFAFLDRSRGFLVGSEGTVLATANAGETWQKLDSEVREHLFKAVFVDGRVLAVGRRGTMAEILPAAATPSSDGGGAGGAVARVPLGIYGWIASLDIGKDGFGLLVGSQGLIMQTSDSGKSWLRLKTKP